jgi:hypothetical protein
MTRAAFCRSLADPAPMGKSNTTEFAARMPHIVLSSTRRNVHVEEQQNRA